jgi:hypothetical protein
MTFFCPENNNCLNGPGGMYHCPYCGAMILPGFSTKGLCLIQEWMKEVAMSTQDFDVGQAIQAIKSGLRVARRGWNGKDMWLSLTPGIDALSADKFWSRANKEFAEENGGSAEVLPAITMKNARGQIVMGWLASQEDLLSEDWFIVN